jgi:hypothetical protein
MERFFLDFLMSTDYYPLLFFIHTPKGTVLMKKNSVLLNLPLLYYLTRPDTGQERIERIDKKREIAAKAKHIEDRGAITSAFPVKSLPCLKTPAV